MRCIWGPRTRTWDWHYFPTSYLAQLLNHIFFESSSSVSHICTLHQHIVSSRRSITSQTVFYDELFESIVITKTVRLSRVSTHLQRYHIEAENFLKKFRLHDLHAISLPISCCFHFLRIHPSCFHKFTYYLSVNLKIRVMDGARRVSRTFWQSLIWKCAQQ